MFLWKSLYIHLNSWTPFLLAHTCIQQIICLRAKLACSCENYLWHHCKSVRGQLTAICECPYCSHNKNWNLESSFAEQHHSRFSTRSHGFNLTSVQSLRLSFQSKLQMYLFVWFSTIQSNHISSLGRLPSQNPAEWAVMPHCRWNG